MVVSADWDRRRLKRVAPMMAGRKMEEKSIVRLNSYHFSKKASSLTGSRTRAAWVRARNPNR